MLFHQRLNRTRKFRGKSAQNMADMLGMQIRGYRKYESGDSSPSLENLVKIADFLDVPVDYLLCRDEYLKSHGASADER